MIRRIGNFVLRRMWLRAFYARQKEYEWKSERKAREQDAEHAARRKQRKPA